MSKVEASLVFGVTEVPKPVETPIEAAFTQAVVAPTAPAPATAAPPAQPEEPPFEFAKPFVPRFDSRQSTTPRVSECPEAPVTAAAEVPPQPRITGDPRPGVSKWKIEGFTTSKAGDSMERQEFRSFTSRAIRNFVRIDAQRYSFEEVAENREGIVVTTFEVNEKPVTFNPSDGLGAVTTPGAGEPERGIVLTKMETIDRRSGQPISTFNPTVGLLVLPLPVIAGERFTSTAVDPRTGQTISRESTVRERTRIDACGEVVDGWLVESTQRQSGGGSVIELGAAAAGIQLRIDEIYGTQYGGVPLLNRFSVEDPNACASCPLSVTQSVAQVNPDPLKP